MGTRRRIRSRLNLKNRADAQGAVIVRTWKADGGTYRTRQRPSGTWEVEFTSDDDEEYIVALGTSPQEAMVRLRERE
jgi:hypothetical protein